MHDDDVPSAGEAYALAWRRLWERFPELLLAALIWMALAVPEAVFRHAGSRPAAFAYHIFVIVPLTFGALYVYLRAARGETVRPAHLFEAFRTAYVRTLVAHVIFVVLVSVGLAMLVVPGVYIATRLAFVGFLVVDERLDPMEAVRESWRRTDGFAGRIFVLWLLAVPISFAGVLLVGVGIVPALMWIHLAFATLFVGVTEGYERSGDELSVARPRPA